MSLEKVRLKRTVLVAQREQILANLNATIGAIAVCDELIAEEQRDAEADSKARAEIMRRQGEALPTEPPPPANDISSIAPMSPPEMLPVINEDDDAFDSVHA